MRTRDTTSEPESPTHSLRICIVGSGGTGSEIAKMLAFRGAVDLTLVDLNGEMAIGRAMDVGQAGSLIGEDIQITGGDSLSLMKDANIVIITAGRGRKPGEPREMMIYDNARTVHHIVQTAAKLCPFAFLIVLTNPADVLTRVAYESAGFPLARVMGQGGVLDSARLSTLVARTLGVSVVDVRSMVLGGHGDSMVPVLDFVSVHGVPAKYLLTTEQWDDIVQRTRYGGEEILSRFQSHGASVTPALAVCEMVDALSRPTPRLLPISTTPNGAYGLHDVFLGLPALVSHQGVERVLELPLSPRDLDRIQSSGTVQHQAWSLWEQLRDQRSISN